MQAPGRQAVEFLEREGVKLAYSRQGQGGPALLFIHGYTCDQGFFQPQMDHFGAGRRVVALDLRGHGASDKPRQEYTLAGLADDCAWLCQRLDLGPLVAVGHSMGGGVALELAAGHPHLVAGLAILDTAIISSRQRREQVLPKLVRDLSAPDYLQAHRQYMSPMFAPWDDPARTPQWVMLALAREMGRWDGATALARVSCPVLVVSSSRPRSDQEALRGLCPWLVSGQTVLSGHFHTLEVPGQVNAMLEDFLARGLGGGPLGPAART